MLDMPLSVGDRAPDFKLPSTEGGHFHLEGDHKGKSLLIYFYPKDFTPGCTAQACSFRDSLDLFRDADIPVVGISQDDIATHKRFQEAHKLSFPLLSDAQGDVAQKYDARVPLIRFTRRITYLLDTEHRIAAVYENLMRSRRHVEEMQKHIQSGLLTDRARQKAASNRK